MALGDMVQVLEGLGNAPEEYRYGAFAQPTPYSARLAGSDGLAELGGLDGLSGKQQFGVVVALGLTAWLGVRLQRSRERAEGTRDAQMREFLRKVDRAGGSYSTRAPRRGLSR